MSHSQSKVCDVCGEAFAPVSTGQKRCGAVCQQEGERRRDRERESARRRGEEVVLRPYGGGITVYDPSPPRSRYPEPDYLAAIPVEGRRAYNGVPRNCTTCPHFQHEGCSVYVRLLPYCQTYRLTEARRTQPNAPQPLSETIIKECREGKRPWPKPSENPR